MKKIFTLILCAVACMAVHAQDDFNRLVIRDKAGAIHPYVLEHIDSMFFYNIEGRVAADIEVKEVKLKTSDDTKDMVTVAITRSESCNSYQLTVVKQPVGDALTTDVQAARYFSQIKSYTYYDNFTNGELTGFDFELQPNTKYYIITLGYDEIGTPCEMVKKEFVTPSKPIQGSPEVKAEIAELTPTSVTMSFKTNQDVGGYALTLFGKGEAEEQFNMFGAWMGFANIGEMVKAWGLKGTKDSTFTIGQLTPGKEYELYIQPWDVNETLTEYFKVDVTTPKFGGEGVAEVTLNVMEFGGDATNGYWQRVVYTPNSNCNNHRDIIITEDGWNNMGGEDGVKTWLTSDEAKAYDYYGIDDAKWNADPESTYYAVAISQNANEEWGPMVFKKFTTPKTTIELGKRKAKTIATRVSASKATGIAPSFIFTNAQMKAKGIQIVEK